MLRAVDTFCSIAFAATFPRVILVVEERDKFRCCLVVWYALLRISSHWVLTLTLTNLTAVCVMECLLVCVIL